MCHRLQLVVDKQLWRHHNETESEQEAVHHAEHKGVPTPVLMIDQRINGIATQERE